MASVLSWQMPPLKKNNARKDYLLATVFDECQRTSSAHKKRIKSLNEVRLKHADSFDKEFFLHIDRILLVWKKEPSVERLCNFITSFVTSNEEGVQGLAMALVKYLLDVADVKDKAVRFRVCQLISLIMNNLNEDAEIECLPPSFKPSPIMFTLLTLCFLALLVKKYLRRYFIKCWNAVRTGTLQ